ncbi:nodulation protein NodH [Epibacterium ulvae]|uniref:nodulation protein NodH n=1 Tax=Epibacterium ulvae TaxID=1156985 RepID=UPI0024919826|nr:nodulation protein NodH [Epibacterium ulvae]
MTQQFDYFVIFAEMRTGSNFLEANLNAFDGIACHGEAFNPHFIGYPNREDCLGITLNDREADPAVLLNAIRTDATALAGFRYFHDHDPRVLDTILSDPRCAKIVLTRNPLDSYVSLKIAEATGQWKLTNVTRRKEAQAHFDAAEFAAHVDALQQFQISLQGQLQRSGQSAFYVAYEDLQDVAVMNGLARWLGAKAQLEGLDDSLKRQNPSSVVSKVHNSEEMIAALAGIDHFNLTRTPNFEPRRGPAVPGYIAAAQASVLYLPIQGGPEQQVTQWLADLDNAQGDALQKGMNQKEARQWMQNNPGFRSFTVVRHPLQRAHAVFCARILNKGPGCFLKIRNTLRRRYNVPMPEQGPGEDYTLPQHRAAFEGFLNFLKLNLGGQTSIRVDANWASQTQVISGFAEFLAPDLIIRESEIAQDLKGLSEKIGQLTNVRSDGEEDQPFSLSQIYDADLERLCRAVYQRDYIKLGFGNWADRA